MSALIQSLITAQSDGAALSNSTAATSLLPSEAKLTVPANYFDYIGRRLKISAQGRLSNLVTTPGTLTIDLRLGGVIFSGGAMQLSTTAHTTVPWWFDLEMTLRTVGALASFMGQGRFFSQAVSISAADPTSGHSFLMVPNTAPAVGNTFNAATPLILDLFATFSIANAANAITLHQYEVQSNVLY